MFTFKLPTLSRNSYCNFKFQKLYQSQCFGTLLLYNCCLQLGFTFWKQIILMTDFCIFNKVISEKTIFEASLPLFMHFHIYNHGNIQLLHQAWDLHQNFQIDFPHQLLLLSLSLDGAAHQAAQTFSLPSCLNCPFAAPPCASWIGCECWASEDGPPDQPESNAMDRQRSEDFVENWGLGRVHEGSLPHRRADDQPLILLSYDNYHYYYY